MFAEDVKKWTTIPSSAVNNTAQILNYYRMRFALAVKWLEEAMDGYGEDTESTIENLVPTSIDENGSIFNGTGYQDGKRLSSGGTVKDQEQTTVTGFIPCVKGDVIRLTGVILAEYGFSANTDGTPGNGIGSLYQYVGTYNSGKTKLHCVQPTKTNLNNIGISVVWNPNASPATKNTVVTLDFSNYTDSSLAYIRLNGIGSGADMIVTKNEEIV
jgi:hypothetical protein